jgi:cytochrome c oxidase assembly factor CtaG
MSFWDATALALLTSGGLMYAIGTGRLAARGARVRRIEPAAFWIGWTATLSAVAPPLDHLAAELFSAHMGQHELLMLVGAPLMAVGRPVLPWLWAMPDRLRHHAASVLQRREPGALWNALTTPAVAWALHGATIWIWHAPVLYEAAVRNEALHAFQHATFMATAVLFWWGLVYGRYGRAAYGASVVFVFITALHTGVLGALFTFSRWPLYPLYAERAHAHGTDPIVDQQLAGILMWVPAGVVLMLFGLGLFLAWLSESDRRVLAAEGRLWKSDQTSSL